MRNELVRLYRPIVPQTISKENKSSELLVRGDEFLPLIRHTDVTR